MAEVALRGGVKLVEVDCFLLQVRRSLVHLSARERNRAACRFAVSASLPVATSEPPIRIGLELLPWFRLARRGCAGRGGRVAEALTLCQSVIPSVCDPAGTTVCYLNGEIFLVDTTTGGEALPLTRTPGFAGPYESAALWSPDGTQIAYLAAGPKSWNSVWVANYTGGSNPHISNPRMVSPPRPWDVTYDDSPSWQPCTAVTKACTMQAFVSPVGKPGSQQPISGTCPRTVDVWLSANRPSGILRLAEQGNGCWTVRKVRDFIQRLPVFGDHRHCASTRGAFDVWAWDEANFETDPSWLVACAGALPKATKGAVYYAPTEDRRYNLALRVPSSTAYRFLEVYAGRGQASHGEVRDPQLLRLAQQHAAKFDAMINIGGNNIPDADVETLIYKLCRGSRRNVVGLWQGGPDAGGQEAQPGREAAIVHALDRCTKAP